MHYDISIPSDATLPEGYRWGAHVSRPGSEGYYVIRERDGAACLAQLRPDYEESPDASELDAAIADAAADAMLSERAKASPVRTAEDERADVVADLLYRACLVRNGQPFPAGRRDSRQRAAEALEAAALSFNARMHIGAAKRAKAGGE